MKKFQPIIAAIAFAATLTSCATNTAQDAAPDRIAYSIGLKERAEQGDAKAQEFLAYCYYEGCSFAKDRKKAAKWYNKAAKQGDANAQNSLGNCYYYGEGVSENKAEAMKWWRKAAEQGNVLAQQKLDFYSAEGKSVPNADIGNVTVQTEQNKSGE